MLRFIGNSFGGKLIVLMTLSSAAAVAVVCAVLVAFQYNRARERAMQELTSQAEMISIHSAAALTFDDPARASETLGALAAMPSIASAAIHVPSGQEFAVYERLGALPPPLSTPREFGHRFEGEWIVDLRPIVHLGEQIGTLRMVYDLAGVNRQVRRDAAAALGAGSLATFVAFLLALWLQRIVARPVKELGATASRVSATKDFSVRAARYSDDELGQLTEAFNDMLAQIEARDVNLGRIRADLARVNEELRHGNEEMKQFIYTVSHDLRSPLVTVIGFITLMRDDVKAGRTEKIVDWTHRIDRGARKMERLLDDMLQLSRIGRVEMEPHVIDTSTMVREVGESLAIQLQKAGAELAVQPDMPWLAMNRTRATQVFENLIGNAIKYGCEGDAKRVEVGGSVTPKGIAFHVRDFGPGISAEHHERIFGLFQRLQNDNRGTGVGLAIVARVMQVHGGRVWVESEPGKGATFRFIFPMTMLAQAAKPEPVLSPL